MNSLIVYPVVIGAGLAIFLAWFARFANFDRNRSYYAVVLTIIASFYILFACIARQAVVIEVFVASIFGILAVLGALRFQILLGVGILIHGIFDMFHGMLINNSGVPQWWPAFCASVDVILGLWVIFLVLKRKGSSDCSENT